MKHIFKAQHLIDLYSCRRLSKVLVCFLCVRSAEGGGCTAGGQRAIGGESNGGNAL